MTTLKDNQDTLPMERERAKMDIIEVLTDRKMYINEKGYLQKCIEILFELGYYRDNKSIFEKDR